MRVLSLALLLISFTPRPDWAGTACIPSVSESSSPRGISLVGHAGVPDPIGTVTYVVRDAARIPVYGSFVILDLSACPDVRLASNVVAPGTHLDCARKTVSGVTDPQGTVTFTIVGGGLGGGGSDGTACLQAMMDGVPFPRAIVSTFDLDGVNGVSALDGSIAAGDLFSNQYRARSDFDFDGRLTALDLSLWARGFFGGGSVSSGAACGP